MKHILLTLVFLFLGTCVSYSQIGALLYAYNQHRNSAHHRILSMKFPNKDILFWHSNSKQMDNGSLMKLQDAKRNVIIEGVYEEMNGISYIRVPFEDIFILNYKVSNDDSGNILSCDKSFKKNNIKIELENIDIDKEGRALSHLCSCNTGNEFSETAIGNYDASIYLVDIREDKDSYEFDFDDCEPELSNLQFIENKNGFRISFSKTEVQQILMSMYMENKSINKDGVLPRLFADRIFDLSFSRTKYSGTVEFKNINRLKLLNGTLTLEGGETLIFKDGLLHKTVFRNGKEEYGDWMSKYNTSNEDYSFAFSLEGLTSVYQYCLNQQKKIKEQQEMARIEAEKEKLKDNPTPYIKALRKLTCKLISKIEYGSEDKLSALQEVIIEKQIYCEDDAARVLAPYFGKIAMTWPRKEVENLIKSREKEFKDMEKLKSDRDL